MAGKDYTALLAPGRIGAMELRNGILVTAVGVSLSEADGHVRERLLAYHEEQARCAMRSTGTFRFGASLMLANTARTGGSNIPHQLEVNIPAAAAITAEVVSFTAADGVARSIKADHVIVAMSASGDLALADRLRGEGCAVGAVGDCTGIGYIEGAIRGGADASRRLTG